jgi:hypothetical protein
MKKTTKPTGAALAFPFPALIVRPPLDRAKSYAESCGVKRVDVLRIERAEGRAFVRERTGRTLLKSWVKLESLASTPAKAAAKLKPFLEELAARPLLTAMAGKTAAGSDNRKGVAA